MHVVSRAYNYGHFARGRTLGFINAGVITIVEGAQAWDFMSCLQAVVQVKVNTETADWLKEDSAHGCKAPCK